MQINLQQLIVPSGHQVLLQNVSWQDFENIIEELGETRNIPRLSYSQGYLELMAPLPVHEFDKILMSNFVEIILEALDIEFICLGSITLKNKKMTKGVEPDSCFYIQHEFAVRGKDRIALEIDPPPDLAIEIDITSRTHFDNYEKLAIPELWRFDGQVLHIFILVNGIYQDSENSLQFPQFALKQFIPEYLAIAKTQGRNVAIKAFRRLIQQQLN